MPRGSGDGAVPTPRGGGGRHGAKKNCAGRACQGVAGQPGARLDVTVSLPCKLPTGLIWHRVLKRQGVTETFLTEGWRGY